MMKAKQEKKKTIAICLQSVLIDGDHTFASPPRAGAADFLSALKQNNFDIIIISTELVAAVESWLEEHLLRKYVSKCTYKAIRANIYLTGNAVNFEGNLMSTLFQIMHLTTKQELIKSVNDRAEIVTQSNNSLTGGNAGGK